MDQLLAVSALHLSTLPYQLSRKTQPLFQAAQLHNRALAAFHAEEATGDGGLYTCLFYSLSGLHNLFDTRLFRDDFSGCLDRFLRFVRSQQKFRCQVQESASFCDSPFTTLYETIIEAATAVAQNCSGSDYDKLSSCIETSGLDQEALESCRTAVKYLPEHACGPTHLLLAWPALIPDSCIVLIEQRRPEALVVLAHYAALLRSRSDFWIFEGSGALLVESICKHLGSFWEDWLQPGISVGESDQKLGESGRDGVGQLASLL